MDWRNDQRRFIYRECSRNNIYMGSGALRLFVLEDECREALYEDAARGYSLEALSNFVNGNESDFSKTGFRYGILRGGKSGGD